MMWTTLQVREARNRTSSYVEVSRHGVRLLSKGGTLRLRYVRFVIVLEATYVCSATPGVPCQKDIR